MDSSIDFLPTKDELAAIEDKIISSRSANSPRKRTKTDTIYDISGDIYDRLGRNISKQECKQDSVPWVKVVYSKGKLFVPRDKRNILKSMRLL